MKAIELRRILYPIDFSDGSRQVVEGTSVLAAMYDSELRLFHVASDSSDERSAEELLASLLALTRRLPERTRVSAAVAYGDPASEIVQHARLTAADLIVLGTDERSAHAQGATALVADIAAHAPCPVLHARPHFLPSLFDDPVRFAEILCCAEAGSDSRVGDSYARLLAGGDHSRVTRVTVLGANDDSVDAADIVSTAEANKRVVHVSLMGSPGPEIVTLAERLQSDLIVMGAVDGIAGVPKLGTTTAYVIAHARCPVLIVPTSCGPSHLQTLQPSGLGAAAPQ
jgi:nucleotide-binding universal stress UspA family protein